MCEKKYSILLVDDDPFVLAGISQEIISEGFAVTIAESGEAALKILEETVRPFHIVITDLIMGAVGGIEVLEKAKQVNPDTMVMVFTGYGDLSSAIQAIRLSADDYLLKPGSPEERSFRIRELIKRYELKLKIKIYEEILPICCVCKRIRIDSPKDKNSNNNNNNGHVRPPDTTKHESLGSINHKNFDTNDNKNDKDNNSDDKDRSEWVIIEEFLHRNGNFKMSHGYCPECYQKVQNDMDNFFKNLENA